jgi:hypothetical protein
MKAMPASIADREPRHGAVDGDLAGRDRIGTGDRAHDLGAARTDESREADDLAGPHRKRYVVDVLHADELAHLESHRRIGGHGGQIGEVRVERTADHQAHHVGLRHLRDRPRLDRFAVANHGDAIGDAGQFFEPVRDIHERDALRSQRRDQREERVGFAIGQRGRRFVHHDHARVPYQRLRDLGELLLRDREPPRRPVERQRDVQFAEHRRRARRGRAAIEEPAAHGLDPEHDVLDHAEIGHEVELLVDHPDAEPFGRLRPVDRHRCAVDLDRSAVGNVRAGEDLHQRRLAGTVFTDQREHFTGADLERHAVERAHAGERLLDPDHAQQHRLLCYLASAFVNVPTGTAIFFATGLPANESAIASIVFAPIWSGCWMASPYIVPALIAARASGVAS